VAWIGLVCNPYSEEFDGVRSSARESRSRAIRKPGLEYDDTLYRSAIVDGWE
jgi:hypothetical protein